MRRAQSHCATIAKTAYNRDPLAANPKRQPNPLVPDLPSLGTLTLILIFTLKPQILIHLEKVKPPLPDPLKTPPFFSQSAKLQKIFETRAERERPLARVDQGNDSKT